MQPLQAIDPRLMHNFAPPSSNTQNHTPNIAPIQQTPSTSAACTIQQTSSNTHMEQTGAQNAERFFQALETAAPAPSPAPALAPAPAPAPAVGIVGPTSRDINTNSIPRVPERTIYPGPSNAAVWSADLSLQNPCNNLDLPAFYDAVYSPPENYVRTPYSLLESSIEIIPVSLPGLTESSTPPVVPVNPQEPAPDPMEPMDVELEPQLGPSGASNGSNHPRGSIIQQAGLVLQ